MTAPAPPPKKPPQLTARQWGLVRSMDGVKIPVAMWAVEAQQVLEVVGRIPCDGLEEQEGVACPWCRARNLATDAPEKEG